MIFTLLPPQVAETVGGDGLDRATVRFQASLRGDEEPGHISHVDIELLPTLTSTPGAATAHVDDDRPGPWQIDPRPDGRFRLRAATSNPGVNGKGPWIISLRGVPLDGSAGDAAVVLTEHRFGQDPETVELPLRLTRPSIRIDHFCMTDESGKPIEPAIRSSETAPIDFGWATAGATSVQLFGPEGEIIAIPQPSTGRAAKHRLAAAPSTTSTYTLVATDDDGEHALAQFTITVTERLATDVLEFEGAGTVEGDLVMAAGKTVTTQDLTVEEPMTSPLTMAPGKTLRAARLQVQENAAPLLRMAPGTTLTTNTVITGLVEGDLSVDQTLSATTVMAVGSRAKVTFRRPLRIPADPTTKVARIEIGWWVIVTKGHELVIIGPGASWWHFRSSNNPNPRPPGPEMTIPVRRKQWPSRYLGPQPLPEWARLP